MLELLRTAIQRINLSIVLALVGLLIAVLAFWFDTFGFRVDRSENQQTTEALERLLDREKPIDVEFLSDGNYLSKEHAKYEITFDDDEKKSCIVRWETEQDEYGIEYDHNTYYLEVHRPEFQHFLSDSVSHGLFESDLQDADQIMFIDAEGCEYIQGHDDKDCFFVNIEEDDVSLFRVFDDLVIQPNEEGINELRTTLKSARLYKDAFEEAAAEHISELQQEIDEYNARAEEIRAAGGELEEFGFTWQISEVRNDRLRFSMRPDDEVVVIVMRVEDLKPEQDSAILSRRTNEFDDYSIEIKPVLPDLDYWIPGSNYELYSLNLDVRSLAEAQSVLSKCAAHDFGDKDRQYRARVY